MIQRPKEKSQKTSLLINAMFIVLLSIAVTSLMVLYIDRLPSNILAGGIATQDIRADQNYEIIDLEATNKLKEEASNASPPVYDFDANLVVKRKAKIKDGFLKAREVIGKKDDQGKVVVLTEEEEEKLKQSFLLGMSVPLKNSDYKIIRKSGFSQDLEAAIIALFEFSERKPIIQDKAELKLREGYGISIRILTGKENVKEQVLTKFDEIMLLSDAKKFYSSKAAISLQKKLNLEFIDQHVFKDALKLVPVFIKVNVTINKSETELRRERARGNVQNIIYKLQKGQTIVRRGDRYEPRHLIVLQGIREARKQTNVVIKFIGVFVLVLLCFLICYQFAVKHIRRFCHTRKDLNFLSLTLILFLSFLRLGSFIGSSLQDAVPFHVDITTFYYVIPIAAGAMMVRYILNAETAFVYSIVSSLLAGLFLEHNFEITAYYFLSSLLAASIIGRVEKRSSVLRRGVYLGLVNLVLVLSLSLIGKVSSTVTVEFQPILVNCVFAFFGGLISALTLLAISPIMEALFNYTTNIQLLELANMNHPLLREMIVRAPGTYHHSQLVGILAEAGTREINGNALLARVGSYYHDIGKMKKPQYFIENQKGVNPHDNLAPSMSALIIEAHVKDGIEMAREFKLPKVIGDFIPEHQGTKLIGYFYHKAKKMAKEDEEIDERHFRYSGPKPQSREAGVVMLADTIEAAVRSMPDKSPQKIRAQVEKLVNMHFVDGQLDECDLTLRDLHNIVDSFVKILIGIYHQRVEYPQMDKPSDVQVISSEKREEDDKSVQPASKANNISPLFKEKHK